MTQGIRQVERRIENEELQEMRLRNAKDRVLEMRTRDILNAVQSRREVITTHHDDPRYEDFFSMLDDRCKRIFEPFLRRLCAIQQADELTRFEAEEMRKRREYDEELKTRYKNEYAAIMVQIEHTEGRYTATRTRDGQRLQGAGSTMSEAVLSLADQEGDFS
ncbi:hypothetical protein FNU79_17740 [Deinococcus detaillensis]|uniref:Uncharacterized protein n=1 Tax=Deinococcus detaillensis TaxID=2592048 RepID=A0A553UH49_9DEIO|nr:hypothetical protein [Deinococcus detaillensis]TSA79533.1 hypothetical protein FNU79_17740 [Deinococcus detaillensis]